MKKIKSLLSYFTISELIIFSVSALSITIAFFIFDRTNYITLIASLTGVTSLIFNAKGNPSGQVLMLVFSLLYGIISYEKAYYGEMITYLGMTAPMAVFALFSWLKNPFNGDRRQVKINRLKKSEYLIMLFATFIVTVIFYYILLYFNTANLIISTISVTTSFTAVYLTARRSEYFAVGYAANDIVLIVLWTMASVQDLSYLSVVICFAAFLVNDIYAFINWSKMKKTQSQLNNTLHYELKDKQANFNNDDNI